MLIARSSFLLVSVILSLRKRNELSRSSGLINLISDYLLTMQIDSCLHRFSTTAKPWWDKMIMGYHGLQGRLDAVAWRWPRTEPTQSLQSACTLTCSNVMTPDVPNSLIIYKHMKSKVLMISQMLVIPILLFGLFMLWIRCACVNFLLHSIILHMSDT